MQISQPVQRISWLFCACVWRELKVAPRQMDYRGSGGQKRARGDASLGEGDWTCAKCGNVNFSFRTTCNLRKCGASKPAHAAPQRTGPTYLQSHEPVPTPLYMGGGTGAPSSVPLGLTSNYGMPLNMSSATGLPYDYSNSMNIPPSYNTIPLQSSYAPPSSLMGGGIGYGAGSALGYGSGSGLGYGTGSAMDGAYGMSMGMARTAVMAGAGTGLYMEENGSRKRRGDTKSDGDWTCPKCGNTNYSFRVVCNMKKCNTPKPSDPAPQAHGKPSLTDVAAPDGSWTCDQCGNVNYPFRTKCNRRSCGAEKPPVTKISSESSSSSSEEASRH